MAAGPGRGAAERGLAVRDVVVHYRDDDGTVATAVDGLSLDVAPGEVLALLGPSGSGKSTLLRAIAGLEPLSAGSISWDGADLAGTPVHRRGFGLLFQDGQLFAHRDVAGNVAFGLQMSGVDRAARAPVIAELLELVGLAGFARREVSTLSGGERQRVALARSLAPRPRLLLLDEPLSALDRALRERLAGEVRAALVATGTTAVFVTHDHDEAFAVADRIAVMDLGRLLQVAEPAELWHRPASRRVAEFLGYEAFVPGDAPGARGLVGEARDDVVLALGPGSLLRADDGVLVGRVVGSGFRRGVVETVVDVDGVGEVTVVEASRAYLTGVALPSPGDRVRLGPDSAAIAVLPA
jgi:thiamine transport system ATP-binding protein